MDKLQTRLEANQTNVMSIISNHISKESVSSPQIIVDGLPLKDKDWKNFYSSTIWKLEQIRDNKMNITWSETTLDDGSKSLIRDARNMLGQPPLNSPQSYTMQIVNAARATEKVLDLELARSDDNEDLKKIAEYRVSEAKALIRYQVKIALSALEKDEPINKKTTKAVNNTLVKILLDTGIDKPGKKIAMTKDFMNFDDTHHHVSTLTSIGKNNTIAVESDVMMLGLTPIQIRQYEAIALSKLGQNVSLNIKDIGLIDMNWYNDLPPIQKDLVHEYAPIIAMGNHSIPTQLRGTLIGLKNAHSKLTMLANDQGEIELLRLSHHTGTPTCHNDNIESKQKQSVTDQNIAQLNAFTGGKTVINVLNSPINPTGIDKELDKQVKNATGENVSKATTPVNNLRKISYNDNSGFQNILDHVANNHCNNQYIKNYLMYGTDKKSAYEQLNSQGDVKDLLVYAMKAKENMTTSHLFFDKNNSNIELSSQMSGVTNALFDRGDKIYNIVTNCASGKDRTGLAMFKIAFDAVCEKLSVNAEEAKGILQSICNSGHTQFMASTNAGSIGCHGIKIDTLTAFPQMFKDLISGLQQDTASSNKFKYDDPNTHNIIVKAALTILTTVIKLAERLNIIDQPTRILPLSKSDITTASNPKAFTGELDRSLEGKRVTFSMEIKNNHVETINNDRSKNISKPVASK